MPHARTLFKVVNHPNSRIIPEEYRPLIEQFILNYYLRYPDAQLPALPNFDQINTSFDEWMANGHR